MKTQIDLLAVLPVRILKPITNTKTLKKADMLADIAFHLDYHGIKVTESVLDSDFLVFKFNGEKVGAIDVRRGRQEFQLPSAEWSTEWDKFFVYLIIQKRAIASRQESVTVEEEADAMQDQYEDETDQSLSPAEHLLKQRYPKSADRIIEYVDESFEVETDNGKLVIIDEESGNVILEEYNAETQTWKAYLTNGEFYAITHKPVQWMTHIANYRN